ncbi:TetR/AcrR family transcriptional regulator [Tsukamurella sp. 8F]|uniref:TetR/AcrR family transcriptional regulator n=1 Tax=unclassified Tsukamurella TaxID=2633480 RepID=UPI0023B9A7E8|nr:MULTISPECIES: TetR/AcrR family transcriptional regulator [unclassified Tsukamurella]MDF0530559.1 TetR/AcrR family transcriptional regulator [Tsukamurella sp. 8J]MDF0586791.1 TetR/AcrR family transcriptional regulator [Tsukamurella sp. 8F]
MPTRLSTDRQASDREHLLDTAESLIYTRGVRAVGMDRLRAESGIPLKRMYSMFPTKEDIVVAVLRRRDRRWRADLAASTSRAGDGTARVLAVFDWLADLFQAPDFRGCVWVNVHGELGSTSPAVLEEVRSHKRAFHDQIVALVDSSDPAVAEAIYLLAEGAIVTAGIVGGPDAAHAARHAAGRLLRTQTA